MATPADADLRAVASHARKPTCSGLAARHEHGARRQPKVSQLGRVAAARLVGPDENIVSLEVVVQHRGRLRVQARHAGRDAAQQLPLSSPQQLPLPTPQSPAMILASQGTPAWAAAASQGSEAGEATGVDALLECLTQEGFLQQREGRMDDGICGFQSRS